MAYSIQYEQRIKRKNRRNRGHLWALIGLILAIALRVFAGSWLETVQKLLLGDGQAVAVFYEDFVKH